MGSTSSNQENWRGLDCSSVTCEGSASVIILSSILFCRVNMTTSEEEEGRLVPRKLHSYLLLGLFCVTLLSMLELKSVGWRWDEHPFPNIQHTQKRQ